MNLSAIFYLAALVLFLLAALGVSTDIALVAWGLTATAAGLLVGSLGVDRRIG